MMEKAMERSVTTAEARDRLNELIRRVKENGEQVVVVTDGEPQAVIISPEEYNRLKGEKGEWQKVLEDAGRLRDAIAARRRGRPLPSPEDVIRQVREERDGQLTGLR